MDMDSDNRYDFPPNGIIRRSVDVANEDYSCWVARPNLALIEKQARRRWLIRWGLLWAILFAIALFVIIF